MEVPCIQHQRKQQLTLLSSCPPCVDGRGMGTGMDLHRQNWLLHRLDASMFNSFSLLSGRQDKFGIKSVFCAGGT